MKVAFGCPCCLLAYRITMTNMARKHMLAVEQMKEKNLSDLIVNVHRKETPNVGDLRSAPLGYFDISPNQRLLEISGWRREDAEDRKRWLDVFYEAKGVIYGGGGLMEFEKYESSLNFVAENKKKCVIWGAGHNSVKSSWAHLKPRFVMDYSGYGLIGCRDDGYDNIGFEWVPCASCMHEAFDAKYEVTREVVFFGNSGMKGFERFVPDGFSDDDIMFNMKLPVEEIITFLASAETVVTSSYHGVYWATLLGKKVVGIPTSSKFYGVRHALPICSAEDWKRYSKIARSYPDALAECRQANIAFADKVKDYFFG